MPTFRPSRKSPIRNQRTLARLAGPILLSVIKNVLNERIGLLSPTETQLPVCRDPDRIHLRRTRLPCDRGDGLPIMVADSSGREDGDRRLASATVVHVRTAVATWHWDVPPESGRRLFSRTAPRVVHPSGDASTTARVLHPPR
jgi:hypothetical protein